MPKSLRINKTLQRHIHSISSGISDGKVYSPKDVPRFVFLCGANRSESRVSERREAILEFAARHLPHSKVFLAEKVFLVLKGEGHTGNLLDIEQRISEFADDIIIVLESNSAFSELGAFSHKTLRKKLIVINDLKYQSSKSFVNLGPIQAITEARKANGILWYDMLPTGIAERDSVGSVFSPLYQLLKEPLSSRATRLKLEDLNPANNFNKNTVMFVHDLLHVVGSVTHKEIVEVLLMIFGKHDFKLKEHLGILNAFDAVEKSSDRLYRSALTDFFLRYDFDIRKVMAAFRNEILRNHRNRIYEFG